jgi:hypothetical protein
MLVPRFEQARDDPELKNSTLRVYLHLVYDLSPVEWRNIKLLALAKKLHVSERTIDSAMSALIRGGYIETRKRTPGSPQAYRLIWSRAVA